MIWGLIVAVLVLATDQLSKFYIANDVMEGHSEIILAPFFSMVRAWNTGVSFSMFSSYGKLGVIILSTFALVVVLLLLWWMYKEKDKLSKIGLGMIIGGAVGNVIDRIMFGAVFDFLDFHIGEHHWPAFNLTDSFICIGAFLIIVAGLWKKKEKK